MAGPLVRHHEAIRQFALDPRRPGTAENIARGFVLFAFGLVKKVAIADTPAPAADAAFGRTAAGEALAPSDAGLGAPADARRIFFDFAGCSDMARGLAPRFGLRRPVNADAPCRAALIREVRRRRHMTPSRFLRDRLGVPPGGNRTGAVRQAVNVIATMPPAGRTVPPG